MTRFAVYTCKNRIFTHRRSSDGTVPHWSSFYRKISLISQVKTRRNKAETMHFIQNEAMMRYQAKTIEGGLKKEQQYL